jgi:hypothetical protein
MSSSLSKYDVFETSIEGKVQSVKNNISLQKQWRYFLFALIITDFLMLWSAFWLAYLIRFRLGVPVFELWVRPAMGYYQQLIIILIVLFLGVFYAQGLYNKDQLLGGTKEYSSMFNATTIGVVAVIAAGFLEPTFILARGWLLSRMDLIFLNGIHWQVCLTPLCLWTAQARILPQSRSHCGCKR